jgi:hypothetical protein
MEEDWRLKHLGTQPYLRGVRFQRMRYRAYRPGWDHDHCVACWAKFAEADLPNEPIQREGHTTCSDYQHGAEYDWVCLECFELFKDAMGWTTALSSE